MLLRRNILLFHPGALGDFIVTWPLALGLGRVLAQSRIFYVTGAQKGALAERALRLESADVESGWHHLFSREPNLPEKPAKLLDGAQWVIGFGADAQDLWAQNVRKLAPHAKLLTLSMVPPAQFAGHVTEHLLAQLKGWPVFEAAMSQMLASIAARGIGGAGPSPAGPVVIHPGAGAASKCWPAGRFLELAGKISQSGRRVRFILGEVELEKWPADLLERFAHAGEVQRPADLIELMAHLNGASAFIGNDSGPGHLAAICGVPTVSIFGPADPVRWRPLGPRVCIVRGEWEQLGVGAVLDAINDVPNSW